ncbi:MAG: hypothetical protein J6X46_06335 [Prevotella sp.]|nr:hypothetical protein [Prevotella sp.]
MKKQNNIIEELKRRRQLFARILLSVFVPIMMLSAVHVHEEASSPECEQCAQHVSHAGHLSADNSHTYNCVLCQFLTLPFVPAVVIGTLFIFTFHQVSRQWNIRHAPCSVTISHSQRGPPALF